MISQWFKYDGVTGIKKPVTITVPSDPKYLCVIRDVTVRLGTLNGMDEAVTEQIKLAVDEACSNVIKHAYLGDPGQKIKVEYRITPGVYEVIIEDNGRKADPDLIKGRRLDEVRPGGLGIHFIRRVFDVFEFDEGRKRGNRLRLVRDMGKEDGNRDKGI
jgi:serine/threonine-protein kinase RsbW